MSKDRLFRAVLFADISKSTQLFETHGNVRAQEIVSKVLSVLSKVAIDNEGVVIKTIGDEVMCSFSKPDNAFQAACEMQECLTRDATSLRYSIAIRIGFHYGEVIRDDLNDVFGDAVNVAARMVGLARAGEIITSRQSVEQLPIELRERTRPLNTVKIRGKKEKIEIFDVLWQQDICDLTLTGKSFPLAASFRKEECKKAEPVLILRYGDATLKADGRRPIILIGRDKSNDLVVNNPTMVYITKVSRRHASVEYRDGWFVVCDHSSNGIGIHSGKGETFFIHRQEHPLQDEGRLILGGPSEDLGTETVFYRVES